MWTSTLELNPSRFIPTKILGSFWRGAYFSSFAPLQIRNLPRQPLPASNWVRVRNSLAGICGSDLHLVFIDGDFSVAPAALPAHSYTYPGHEVVGEVIEVGEDVQSLRVGDRVVLQHGPNCLTAGIQPPCRSCASGNYGLCENGLLSGPQPIGGGWSEEMLLHEQQLFPVPPSISDAQAVLLEPSAVAVHAVLRHLPQAGDHVLIIGAGTIGQLILQVVRALAPDAEVNVLARHPFQIERAAGMGARIIYSQDSYEEVQKATGAQLYQGMFGNKMLLGGYDVVYDSVGSKRTTHDALRWARAGSTVVMVGLSLHRMHIDLTPIWYQEVNLIGALGHGIETWPAGTNEKRTTFEITAELIASGRIHPDKLITHSFLLSEYRTALMTARNKAHNRAIKVVFDFSKQPPSVVPNVRAAARQRQRTGYSQGATDSAWEAGNAPDSIVLPTPSQLPVPDDAGEQDQTPTPVAYTIEPPVQYTTDADEDARTIVVSPSKHAHYDVTTHYGSLPGFHQGLEELGIASSQNDDNDDTRKVTIVSPSQRSQNVSPTNADEEHIEAPFITSANMDTGNDFAWAQFIAAQDTSESSLEVPPITSPDPGQSNVETPPAMSQNTGEAFDDPKTVVVSPAKRTRSKRDASKAAPREENSQSIPVDALNQEQQRASSQETEDEAIVTKDPPDAFLE